MMTRRKVVSILSSLLTAAIVRASTGGLALASQTFCHSVFFGNGAFSGAEGQGHDEKLVMPAAAVDNQGGNLTNEKVPREPHPGVTRVGRAHFA